MHSYVINLDRAPERLALMQAQFERLGISFSRISAVDAKLMTKTEIDEFDPTCVQAHHPRPWSPAHIAIFLSHRKVWSEIAAANDSHAAIFEDDVHLSDRIAPFLRDSIWIDRTMDLVRFETTFQGMKLGRLSASQVAGIQLFKVRSGAWGAAGYVIRRDIAAWLAISPRHVYEPVDWFLFHKKSPVALAINVFQVDPALCVQDQYHPDVNFRMNFEKVTQSSAGIVHAIKMAGKQALSPFVRRMTGRRGVPLA